MKRIVLAVAAVAIAALSLGSQHANATDTFYPFWPNWSWGTTTNVLRNTGNGLMPSAAFTVSTLPTCDADHAGAIAYVTDLSSPTYGGALTGSSTTKGLALCNGSAWLSH